MKKKTLDKPTQASYGMHDSIVGEVILTDIPDKTVYVSSQSELVNYQDYPAGTLAIQYGFVALWQLKPDKTWVPV